MQFWKITGFSMAQYQISDPALLPFSQRSHYARTEAKVTGTSNWRGICPDCRAGIGIIYWPSASIACPGCGSVFPATHGILMMMKKHRFEQFRDFVDDYTRIRYAECQGIRDASYYLRLPEPSMVDSMAWQWRMRTVSYQHLISSFLSQSERPLKIIDVGAGVGWLSHRLAGFGHCPIAIDLNIDPYDGLMASSHYGGAWPRVQAEFDHLPLEDNQADLVIYNASLHYSIDYQVTLCEALRVLNNEGRIVILDSPVYELASSGEQMKTEKHNQFEQQYGFRSDSINSIEYLTWDILKDLGSKLRLSWEIIKPWYGWRWALRPLAARLKGKRKPSCFAVIIGTRIT